MASRMVTRALVVGVLAGAALAAPAYSALSAPEAVHQAEPSCTAWFGSRTNGKCIAYSLSGQGSVLNGVPITVNGPTTGNPGMQTGPIMPGQTISTPLG